jgi:transcriptional regulator with XRE-family HTH domain
MMKLSIEQQREKWAAQIQAARRDRGISQEELSRLSGFSLSYIQKIENAVKGSEAVVVEILALLRKKAS